MSHRLLALLLSVCVLSLATCGAGIALQQFPVVNTWIKGNAVAGVPPFRVAQTMVNVGRVFVPGQTNAAYGSVMFGGEGPGDIPESVTFHNDSWLLIRREGEQPWWSPCVPLSGRVPPGRNLHSMVSLGNGSVLVFGGFSYPAETSDTWWPAMDDLWRLDAESCEWTALSPIRTEGVPWPSARAGHTAEYFNGTMVVFGGCGSLVRGHGRPLCHNSSYQYNDVWVFDIATSSWHQQNTSSADGSLGPTPRYNHLSVVLGGGFFVVAGQDDNWFDRHSNPPHEADNDVFSQDDDDDAPNPAVREYHLREVWRLELQTWVWQRQPNGPTDPSGSVWISGKGSLIALNSETAVMMAVPFDRRDKVNVWLLHGTNGTLSMKFPAPSWNTIPTMQSVYPGGFNVVVDERQNNTLLVAGYFEGPDGDASETANVYLSVWETFLSAQGVMWQSVKTLNSPPARYGHCAALVGENVFVFGGASSTRDLRDTFLNDMWSLDNAKSLFNTIPTWRRVMGSPFVPRSRMYHECFAFSNETMLMIGGRQASCDPAFARFQIFIFDTIWSIWQPIPFEMTAADVPEPPSQYYQFASALSNLYYPHLRNESTLGPFVLISGGQNFNCITGMEELTLDSINSTWLLNMSDYYSAAGRAQITYIPHSPTPPRHSHSMITMGGPKMQQTFFVIFGGASPYVDNTKRLNDVWIMQLNISDVSSSRWQNVTCIRTNSGSLPVPRASHLARSIGPYKMFISGGEELGGISLDDSWMFEWNKDTSCGTWTQLQTYVHQPYFFAMTAAVAWQVDNDFPFYPNDAIVLLFGGRLSKHEISGDLAMFSPGCNSGYSTVDMWHYACQPCDIGFYQGYVGTAACTPCPVGVTTSNVGSTSEYNCTRCMSSFCRHGGECSVLVNKDGNRAPICTDCEFGYGGDQCDKANALYIFIFVVCSGTLLIIVGVGGFFLVRKLMSNSKEKGRAETALRLYDRAELVDETTLGTGSFGRVIKCLCTRTGSYVAVKEMQHTGSLVSFVREITTSGDVKSKQHPNIVKLLGYGWLLTERPDANSLFLVFEHLSCTLRDHIRGKALLDLDSILRIAHDVAAGMDHFHTVLKVLHRDLKSSNILMNVDPSGAVICAKVADMGLAAPVKGPERSAIASRTAAPASQRPAPSGATLWQRLSRMFRSTPGILNSEDEDVTARTPLLSGARSSIQSAEAVPVPVPTVPHGIPRGGTVQLPAWEPPHPRPVSIAIPMPLPLPVQLPTNLAIAQPPQKSSPSKSGSKTLEAPIEPFPDSSVWTDSPQEESKSSVPGRILCVGTVGWQAPELLNEGLSTTASDVFSYGVVLWEMMTLGQPFADQIPATLQGEERKNAISQIVRSGGTPTYPLPSSPHMHPTWLVHIMRSCWSFEYNERPSFKDILRVIKDDSPSSFLRPWKKFQ